MPNPARTTHPCRPAAVTATRPERRADPRIREKAGSAGLPAFSKGVDQLVLTRRPGLSESTVLTGCANSCGVLPVIRPIRLGISQIG